MTRNTTRTTRRPSQTVRETSSIESEAARIRSEWTPADWSVRRVSDPAAMLMQALGQRSQPQFA